MNWLIESMNAAIGWGWRLKSPPQNSPPLNSPFKKSPLRIGRRGSVLIIVIGLLVLMAIIGTAYVSTARIDRIASATNSENTQAQLQLQGLQDMVTSQMIADVDPYVTTEAVNGTAVTIDATRFRPGVVNPTAPYYTPSYAPYNSPLNDQWLCSRIPVTPDSTVAMNPSAGTTFNPPAWRFIGYPLAGPFTDPTNGATYGGASNASALGGQYANATSAGIYYVPTAGTYSNAIYPYLSVYQNSTNAPSGTYMAADTDGDGIADAGLFRMPGGAVNGVTYFGAFRVIDNSAAINASIAWAPQQITQSPPAPGYVTWANGASQRPLPGNFWPTNVNLAGLVQDSLSNLNTYRFGTTTPSATPTETGLGFAFQSGYPTGNNYDTVWNELDRRLQNPNTGYNALTQADSAAMAHRFVIEDPNASLSNFENYLPVSTYYKNNANVLTSPYLASDTTDWFNQNFVYNIGSQSVNLRSLLTAYNPVSCFSPSKFGPMIMSTANNPTAAPLPGAPWTATLSTTYPYSTTPTGAPYTSYTFGDWVTYNNHAYVCIQPNSGQTPGTTLVPSTGYYADTAYWCYEPWSNAPVKTNVNTGTFAQLWLAYWSVMCDSQNAAPLPQANSTTTVSSTGAMFRSSLRYSTGAPGSAVGSALSATQELQLRAAIAAVNTIDLRTTGTTNVTSESAPIDDYSSGTGKPLYYAVVSGNKPQPYITEVYADNDPSVGDGASGYIAVEVYNPYPYPIQLQNWAFATVTRTAAPGTPLTVQPLVSTTTGATNWSTVANAPIIPANGYAVFTNTNTALPTGYTTGPTASTANNAAPTAAKPPLYYVSDLNQVFGSDLVLMRPPSVLPPTSTGSSNPVITTWIPADSYDFTGLAKQNAFTNGITAEWLYIRPQATPWTFVYPGPFNPANGGSANAPRFTATQAVAVANAGQITLLPNLTSLGVADAAASTGNPGFPTTPMTIQLNNIDFGGPVKLNSSNNYFPFGQFPRNGDIMQVPFIGSYCIYDGSNNLIEMNPITLDSAYAASTGGDQTVSIGGNYVYQNIGRFAPYWNSDYSIANPTGIGTPYGWATRLFDYLTVQAPGDDYLPNTDPVQYQLVTGKTPLAIANAKPSVINALASQTVTEDTVPVQGLININTAPWRVLATLPFSDDSNTNAAIAQAIVNYRDGYYSTATGQWVAGYGPFRTVYDLNNVMGAFNYTQTGIAATSFPAANGGGAGQISFASTAGSYNNGTVYANEYNWLAPSHPPSNNDGLLTPLYSTWNTTYPSTTIPYVPTTDFQEQNLALTRVSNLITTRSDSYTVYVLVQGWSNAGTANAKLVVQRRAAFIVDRSGTTPSNPTVKITNVSTN